MVKEAQLEAISLFAFQRARLSLSVLISVKGASFWLIRLCLAFSSRVLVILMIGWLEHIFVWFFNFYWLTGSFDLVIFSRWLTWGYPAVSDIGFLLAYREYILQEYC
jgi:hypothetical protein